MRRLLIGPALIAARMAPAGAAPSAKAPPECPFKRTLTPERGVFHRLGDLPPAHQYLAVYRMIDGCRADVIHARGLGSPEPGATAPRR